MDTSKASPDLALVATPRYSRILGTALGAVLTMTSLDVQASPRSSAPAAVLVTLTDEEIETAVPVSATTEGDVEDEVAEGETVGPEPPPRSPQGRALSAGEEPPTGRSLVITGGVLTGIGVPALITTGVLFGCCGDDDTGGRIIPAFGLMLIGIQAVGAGVPLLAVGLHRRRRWNRWRMDQVARLTPSGGRSALGTNTVGFTVRF